MNRYSFPIHLRRFAPAALVLTGALVAIAAYLQALHYPFILDDIPYIVWNNKLAGLHLTELWRLFIEPYNDLSEFLPLRDLSYWLGMKMFGLTPSAFRMYNMFLYLMCLPLIYSVTLSLWRYFRPVEASGALWAAAAVAALFALHPSHAEAVVWISGCKDVQSAMFSLLALWFAIRAKRADGLVAPYATAALIALVAAMLSKATAVAVGPIIAMFWMIFWRDIPTPDRHRSILLWPFASLLLCACIALIFATMATERVPFHLGIETVTRSFAILGWLARLAVSSESRHFYYPLFEDTNLHFMVALGVAVLAGVLFGAVSILRGRSLWGFASVSFLMLCLPSIQLIPYAPPSFASDRFVFLALWPVLMLVVALAWRLNTIPRTAFLLVIALAWSIQTVERPRDWRDFEALVDADLRTYPGYYMPAVYKITSFQLPRGQYDKATRSANGITTPEFRNLMLEVINIHHGTDADAVATGKLIESIRLLWKLKDDLGMIPAQAAWNLPFRNLWIRMPYFLAVEWQYLAERNPDDMSVRYNAGLWNLGSQRYPDAVAHLRIATRSQHLPKNLRGTAFHSLGLALLKSGSVTEAEGPLREALEQSPPEPRASCSLAELYQQTGRIREAASAETDCRSKAPKEATPP
ncbi:MAG: hypothetical protein ABI479_11410 [Gallionella sp.]